MLAAKLHGKRIVTVLLALLVLVPASVSYAQNEDGNGKRVEKFIELAERAKDKTETLINITVANLTAMSAIEGAGLLGEFQDNVTLFNEAVENIANARECLGIGDLEGAIEYVTPALEALREVYKGVNRILAATPEVQRGQLVDAQGLIQAMKRALERIDRLRGIEGLPQATSWILDNATLYLNVTRAIELLQVGMVNETTYNMTQVNKLISLAHSTLQKRAVELKTQRVRSYIKVIENLHNRLSRQVGKLEDGPEKTELQGQLDIAGVHIGNARDRFGEGEDSQALGELLKARNILEEVEQGLKVQGRAEKENGNGNGNGNGPD